MKNRKGFTIVELVIVIAVIAILAAVLIPTFSGVIGKANANARTQEFTNALKVVLAGNAETGALAEKTIFVSSEKEGNTYVAAYYAVYNGNKLGEITAAEDKLSAATIASAVDKDNTVSYVDDGDKTVKIYSVILPFGDNGPIDESKDALTAFFGGNSSTYNSTEKTITITKDETHILTLNCYSNLDLAKGMFVLYPNK